MTTTPMVENLDRVARAANNISPRIAMFSGIYGFILTLLIALSPSQSASAASPDPDVAAICNFLKSPPALLTYKYEKITHVTMDRQKIPAQIVRGRWSREESNWFQIVNAPSGTNEARAFQISQFSGRQGTAHWVTSRGDITIFDTKWNTNKESVLCNMGKDANDGALLVVRLGLGEVDFPNVEWEGSYFRGNAALRPDTPMERRWRVDGRVSKRSESEWELSATNSETGLLQNQAIVRGRTHPDGVFHPDEIEVFMFLPEKGSGLDAKGWTKLVTLRVLEFIINGTEPTAAMFDPLQMAEIVPKSYHFYTNDTLYGFSPFTMKNLYTTNELSRAVNYHLATRTYTVEEGRRSFGTKNYRRPIFLMLVAIMLGGLILLFIQKRKKQQITHKNTG